MHWLKLVPIIILLFTSFSFVKPIMASEPMSESLEDIVRVKEWRLFSFYDTEYFYRLTFTFALNGSVIIQDNCGSYMKINIPQFEMAQTPILHTSLWSNSTHVLHRYQVKTPSDKVIISTDAYYDLQLDKGVKITLEGSGVSNVTLKLHFQASQPLVFQGNRVRAKFLAYDWNDAVSICSFNKDEDKLSFSLDKTFFVDPKIISTVSESSAIRESYQRKSFYTKGLYWIFYCNSNNMVYRTSSDGTTWTGETVVRGSEYGYNFAIWYNSTIVSYVCYISGGNLAYRCGTPQSDGSISWFVSEQTITDIARNTTPTITVDSGGYPWIGTANWTGGLDYSPYVLKSEWNNGSWSTATGFPYKLSTTGGLWSVAIVPLTLAKTYVFYYSMGLKCLYGRLYSVSWGPEETIVTDSTSYSYYSAIGVNDDVHVVYCQDDAYTVDYRKRISGTWASPETIYEDGISPTQLTKDGEDIYISYSTGAKLVTQARFSNGTSSSSEVKASYGYYILYLQSYYQVYDGKNALVYMEYQSPSTYKLWWAEPDFGKVWTEPEPPASSGQDDGEPAPFVIPKVTIPVWGYYIIAGSLAIVAVGALINKGSSGRRGVRGVKRKSPTRRPRNLQPRPRKLRKRSKTGRFT